MVELVAGRNAVPSLVDRSCGSWSLLAAFVPNAAVHFALETYDANPVLLWQAPVTLWVIVRQMRSPWYHGIFARQINPRLADYLNDTL